METRPNAPTGYMRELGTGGARERERPGCGTPGGAAEAKGPFGWVAKPRSVSHPVHIIWLPD